MSLYTKQEMDTAVKMLERKIEFVMKAFSVQNPLNPFGPPKNLLQIFYEVTALGVSLDEAVNGVDAVVTETLGEVPEGVVDVSVDEACSE